MEWPRELNRTGRIRWSAPIARGPRGNSTKNRARGWTYRSPSRTKPTDRIARSRSARVIRPLRMKSASAETYRPPVWMLAHAPPVSTP